MERAEQQEDSDHHTRVADHVHHKSLACRRDSGGSFQPKPDQQVGRKANQTPANQEEQEIVGQDEHKHGEDENVHVGEEPRKVRIISHVPHGIDVDQETDAGDHQQHHGWPADQ